MGGLNLSSCPAKCASLSITLNLKAACKGDGLEEQKPPARWHCWPTKRVRRRWRRGMRRKIKNKTKLERAFAMLRFWWRNLHYYSLKIINIFGLIWVGGWQESGPGSSIVMLRSNQTAASLLWACAINLKWVFMTDPFSVLWAHFVWFFFLY